MSGREAVAVPDHYRLVAQLNREWHVMERDRDDVAGWVSRHDAVRGCWDLGEVLAAVAGDPDGVLGALLRESAAGSTLAARVVLQAMLGKVVLMARADPTIGVDGYLFGLWERIRTYPIERRSTHIAANLALDARKFARGRRSTTPRTTPWPPDAAFAELVEAQLRRERTDHGSEIAMLTAGDVIRSALQLELIDDRAGALLRDVYADGLSGREAAARHATSVAMVRQRCSRAVRLLADHSHELAGIA